MSEPVLGQGAPTPAPEATPPATPEATPTPAPAPQPQSFDWGKIRESLPEELRNEPSLKPVNSVETLVKNYVNAQKAVGNKIPIPDKHATEEDWKQVFHKLGVPDKVDDYSLNMPKDAGLDEEFLGEFKKAAFDAGVLPWQAEKVLGWINEKSKVSSDALTQAEKARIETDINTLKQEWGKDFDTKLQKANIAFKHFLPDQKAQQSLVDAGFGNNIELIKLLENAARTLSEDQIVGAGGAKFSSMTGEDALKKAREIQGDMNHPYRNKKHPNHEAAKLEVQNLYKIAFPEA